MNRILASALFIVPALLAACDSSKTPQDPAAVGQAPAEESAAASGEDFYSLSAESLEGEPVELSQYRGKVALVVNVASRCGYTPQYGGLQSLYRQHQDSGLVVLAFPSNDFGGQEPGSPAEIRQFCTERYGVEFPVFAKVRTKAGSDQSPIYAMLGAASGELPKWNFCKYLIGRDGEVLGFFESNVDPDSPQLRAAIDAALN